MRLENRSVRAGEWFAVLLFPVIGCAAAILFFGKPVVGVATAAFFLLCAGLAVRRRTWLHMRLMKAGMGLDVAVVLFLQIHKNAVGTVVNETLSGVQTGHVLSSTCALLLYLPVYLLGRRLANGPASPGLRSRHLAIGLTAFGLRAAGFVLMLLAQTQNGG